MRPYKGTDHLSYVLRPEIFTKVAADITSLIRTSAIDFDAIAFCGHSGALLVPTVATNLGVGMLMVRKSIQGCHSIHPVEGFSKTEKYIIIDDLIDTGKTIDRIQRRIKNHINNKAKCVGIFLYGDWRRVKTAGMHYNYKGIFVAGLNPDDYNDPDDYK